MEVLRKDSERWIESLTEEEKKAILKYTDNGIDPDGMKLYEKINKVVGGEYIPVDEKESELLFSKYNQIYEGIEKIT